MGVKDHLLSQALQLQTNRYQFRIVQVVDISIQFNGLLQHSISNFENAIESSRQAANIDNLYLVLALITQAICYNQGNVMAMGGEATTLLVEYSYVESWMNAC